MTITDETETAFVLTKSVFELLDCVEGQLSWMVTYALENNLPTERFTNLHHLLARTHVIMQDLQELELQIANRRNGGPRDKLTPYLGGRIVRIVSSRMVTVLHLLSTRVSTQTSIARIA